jgi:hypothetical protein
MAKDITDLVTIGASDGDTVPLYRCVCGKEYAPWDFTLSSDEDRPRKCRACGRRMYIEVVIRVFEIE